MTSELFTGAVLTQAYFCFRPKNHTETSFHLHVNGSKKGLSNRNISKVCNRMEQIPFNQNNSWFRKDNRTISNERR